MNIKKLLLFIIIPALLFIGFVFYWWIYSKFSYPLDDKTSNPDYDSYLETKVPLAATEASGTSLDDKFYLLGGLGPVTQSYATLFCYDSRTKEWSKLKNLPFTINHAGFVAGDGKLYMTGGFKPLSIRIHGFMFANWKPRSSFLIFDPTKNEWETGPEMPFARGAGGVCYHDSAIYYAGGINESKKISDSFFKFDLRTYKWEILPPLPTPRDHMRMEAVDGNLYAISGRKDDMRYNLPCVEAFNTKTNTWSKKADIPTARGGFGSVVFNGKIYTFGGENVWSSYDIIEEYDPENDSWRKLTPLPEPRHGICAGVIGNEIHLVSGGLKARISISRINRVIKISLPENIKKL